jgi:DNA-binding MarR family transcriptional regulator
MELTDGFVDSYLPYLFARADALMSARLEHVALGEAVSTPMWRAVCQLADRGPATIGELATTSSVPQPTMSRAIERLDALSWVSREGVADDGRATRVALTVTGRKAVRQLVADAQRAERVSLAGFTAADVEQLRDLMSSLVRHLANGGGRCD